MWEDDRLLIETPIDLDFSPAAVEALENGVALVVVITIRASRWLGPIPTHRDVDHRRMEIRFLPLSRHWQLTDQQGGETRSFARRWMLEQALATEARRFETGLGREALSGDTWQVEIRAAVDRNALPPPMHLPALLSNQWRLASRWYAWPFEDV